MTNIKSTCLLILVACPLFSLLWSMLSIMENYGQQVMYVMAADPELCNGREKVVAGVAKRHDIFGRQLICYFLRYLDRHNLSNRIKQANFPWEQRACFLFVVPLFSRPFRDESLVEDSIGGFSFSIELFNILQFAHELLQVLVLQQVILKQ